MSSKKQRGVLDCDDGDVATIGLPVNKCQLQREMKGEMLKDRSNKPRREKKLPQRFELAALMCLPIFFLRQGSGATVCESRRKTDRLNCKYYGYVSDGNMYRPRLDYLQLLS